MSVSKQSQDRYFEAVGRRKLAVARVRIFPHSKKGHTFQVNDQSLEEYFPRIATQQIVRQSLNLEELTEQFHVSILVKGGGVSAQAEAARHGLARALVLVNEDLRRPLRHLDLMKRDPRKKERKKFGLKKARKAPQWSKR